MLNSILLVDDNQVTCFITLHQLEQLQAAKEIQVAGNTDKALEMLSALAPAALPELILLDLNMPGPDGFSFLEQFEKKFGRRKRRPRVVIYSTSVRKQDQERAAQFPSVVGYVEKPLTPEKLQEVLAALEAEKARPEA